MTDQTSNPSLQAGDAKPPEQSSLLPLGEGSGVRDTTTVPTLEQYVAAGYHADTYNETFFGLKPGDPYDSRIVLENIRKATEPTPAMVIPAIVPELKPEPKHRHHFIFLVRHADGTQTQEKFSIDHEPEVNCVDVAMNSMKQAEPAMLGIRFLRELQADELDNSNEPSIHPDGGTTGQASDGKPQ